MSLLPKILFLLISFILLNIFSIYNFDYDWYFTKEENKTKEEKKPLVLKEEPKIIKTEPDIKKLENPTTKETVEIPKKITLTKKDIQDKVNTILQSKKISFERRSSTITEDSKITVQNIAKILKENPTFKVEIAGHTDSRGKDELNKQISQDRANSVKNFLISLGVEEKRLTAVGYGEEFPIAKDDENGLSEINRRVEFNILGE